MLEGLRKDHAKRRRALWATAAGLTVVVFAVLAGFFFMEAREAKEAKGDPQSVQKATTERIIDKVSKLYQLPIGDPTVAQVQDKSQLQGQPFFAQAEDGDYILIFADAKMAFLYREDINKLVNVGPVSLDAQGVAGENTEKSN